VNARGLWPSNSVSTFVRYQSFMSRPTIEIDFTFALLGFYKEAENVGREAGQQ
jgi:hypothetical protein